MNELSMHILDLAQNSIVVNSTTIKIVVQENTKDDVYKIMIIDDGRGMDEKTISQVFDPFYTTRTTRKVGLGISLFKMTCEQCDGELTISSMPGKGTTLIGTMKHKHIDRPPMGDIVSSLIILMLNDYDVNIDYVHEINDSKFEISTQELKDVLGGVPLSNPDVIDWIRENIKEGIYNIQLGGQNL